jgi:hypothetical protein
MKINISASVEKSVDEALTKFCELKKDNSIYRRSKSDVVNEALKEYLIRNGVVL